MQTIINCPFFAHYNWWQQSSIYAHTLYNEIDGAFGFAQLICGNAGVGSGIFWEGVSDNQGEFHAGAFVFKSSAILHFYAFVSPLDLYRICAWNKMRALFRKEAWNKQSYYCKKCWDLHVEPFRKRKLIQNCTYLIERTIESHFHACHTINNSGARDSLLSKWGNTLRKELMISTIARKFQIWNLNINKNSTVAEAKRTFNEFRHKNDGIAVGDSLVFHCPPLELRRLTAPIVSVFFHVQPEGSLRFSIRVLRQTGIARAVADW